MKSARMLGNYAEYLMEQKCLSVSDLSKILECTESQVLSFLKGRFFFSFEQISTLAKSLACSVEDLLTGNEDVYNRSVVHCMHQFSDAKNREKILDIIDNYIDVKEALQ